LSFVPTGLSVDFAAEAPRDGRLVVFPNTGFAGRGSGAGAVSGAAVARLGA
jgi:hypothetical protein